MLLLTTFAALASFSNFRRFVSEINGCFGVFTFVAFYLNYKHRLSG